MRLDDTPAEAAWRAEVRQFLKENLPHELRRRIAAEELPKRSTALDAWRESLARRGWIAPAWPEEYGGAGLGVIEQFIMNEEFALAGAPRIGGMGVGWAGPTIIVHGTAEQKAQHLPPILRGEAVWCQGFSEPDAGSDLASLKTTAVPDADDYIINGTKIWTSGAHNADWMFMLARTDPEAPKHHGITYFLLDMKSQGITIQPLVQMTGAAGFNQVHFDNVCVPKSNIVGEVNRGWYVATTTLDFERAGTQSSVNISRAVEDMLDWARTNKASRIDRRPALRHQLIDRYIEARVSRMLSHRVAYLQSRGQIPNYEASMAKLFSAEALQRVARTAMQMVGLYGLVWNETSEFAAEARFSRAYVQTVSTTIMGGTSEIQRNIISQRGLGMPRT